MYVNVYYFGKIYQKYVWYLLNRIARLVQSAVIFILRNDHWN